jgi:hypothetical protein
MTNLSPATQAVLTAATQRIFDLDPEDVLVSSSEYSAVIAAALRAAADSLDFMEGLYEIAAELEGAQ